MANRLSPPNTFAGLTTAYASNLDANFTNIQNAMNDASLGWTNYQGTDSGSANNYIVVCGYGSPSAYNAGMMIAFPPAHLNTGPSTLTVTPLSALPIQLPNGAALKGGELVPGVMATLICNGTAFVLVDVPWMPVVQNLGSLTTAAVVNCVNASSIAISFTLNTSASVNVSMQNVNPGTPIFLFCLGSANTTAFYPFAYSPGGTGYTTLLVQQGFTGSRVGFAINAGTFLMATGSVVGSYLLMFGIQSA